MINFECPHCEITLEINNPKHKKKSYCPACHNELILPETAIPFSFKKASPVQKKSTPNLTTTKRKRPQTRAPQKIEKHKKKPLRTIVFLLILATSIGVVANMKPPRATVETAVNSPQAALTQSQDTSPPQTSQVAVELPKLEAQHVDLKQWYQKYPTPWATYFSEKNCPQRSFVNLYNIPLAHLKCAA